MRQDLDQYLAQVQSGGVLPQTIVGYRSRLTPLLAFLGRRGCRRIADVARDDLTAYLVHLVDLGRSKRSRMDAHGIISRFFAWLQEAGRIVVNPAKGLPLPDDGEEDLPQPPLSEAEVAAIIDGLPRATVLDLRAVCLLELLYGCGLRRSEALRLDLADVDLGRRTVLVRESKHGQTRVVPLPQTARVAIQTYLVLRRTLLHGPDTGALFLTVHGRRMQEDSVYEIFDRLNAQAGADARHLHPHLLRHSVAVHLLRRGADIRHIQAFLGHANLNTTKIYLRLVPGHLAEDYEKAMPEIETGLGAAPPLEGSRPGQDC
jgi:integrase/recombinase XerD